MNPNPFSDTLAFLLQPGWPTPIFWLLLIASAGIAAYAGILSRANAHYRISGIGASVF